MWWWCLLDIVGCVAQCDADVDVDVPRVGAGWRVGVNLCWVYGDCFDELVSIGGEALGGVVFWSKCNRREA